jgi:glutamate dehydrogenase
VIEDCYRQTHSLSITAKRGVNQMKEQVRFIHDLERAGKLDRALEFIPDDEEISDRIAKGNSLTRPELAVLLAYSKMVLKEELVHTDITDNPYYDRLLISAFPKQLRDKYQNEMQHHPLRAEIIATKLANKIGNDMGFNFVNRMQEETGATVVEIANCYTIASAVFELEEFWQKIEILNNKISTAIQTEMLFQYRRTVRRATRWFLRHRNKALAIEQSIALYQPTFTILSKKLNNFIIEEEANEIQRVESDLIAAAVPKDISQRISQLSTIFSALDIAAIAAQESKDVDVIANLYFKLGVRLELHWFLEQITRQAVANHWQALARASFREELDWQQRSLTVVVLQCDCSVKVEDLDDMLDAWMKVNEQPITRWQHILSDFKIGQAHEFAMFSVALRELMLLSLNCEKVSK